MAQIIIIYNDAVGMLPIRCCCTTFPTFVYPIKIVDNRGGLMCQFCRGRTPACRLAFTLPIGCYGLDGTYSWFMWRIRLARNNSTGTGTYKSKTEGKVEMRKFKSILKKMRNQKENNAIISGEKGKGRDRERKINPEKEDQ